MTMGTGTVLDHARRAIVLAAPSGEIHYLNDRFTEYTGHRRDRVVGRPYEAFVHPDDLPRESALFGRIVAGDLDVYDGWSRLRTADGEVRWFRLSVTAVEPGADGRPARIMATLTLDADRADPEAPVRTQGGRVFVQDGSSTLLFAPGELEAILAEGVHSVLHTSTGTELVRVPLRAFEAGLSNTSFCRIHRSTIVDLETVHAFRPLSRGDAEVRLRNGMQLRVARSRRDRVEHGIRTLGLGA